LAMLQGPASKNYERLRLPDQEQTLAPGEPPSPRDQESSSRKKCKDPLFALLFLGGVGIMIYAVVQNRDGLSKEWEHEVANLKDTFSPLEATKTLGISFGIAGGFSLVWLIFMRNCVKFAVYGLFAISIAAELFGCAALFYLANTNVIDSSWEKGWLNAFGVLAFILFGYTCHVLYMICHRVALAASLIKVAGSVLARAPLVFVVGTFMALCHFAWMVFVGGAAWAILSTTESNSFWISLGLALMGYWGLQVLGNIAVVANYGTLGRWYYGGKDASPAVCGPLCLAFTAHFGSICFGSLLVAIIETVHDMLHAVQKKTNVPSWVLCCVDRAMAAVQASMEYTNKYGFVQVAVHDEHFFSACKRALSFLKYKGLTALVNDSIIARLAQVGAYAGGLLSGAIPVMLNRYWQHEDVTKLGLDGTQETTMAFAGFFLGFFTVYTLISPFASMGTALLVCFAEHPEVLYEDHAEDYKTLIESWESVYGADFVDKAATRANLDIERSGLYVGSSSKMHPIAEELEKLVQMKHAGQLTEAEFEEAKAKLLSN